MAEVTDAFVGLEGDFVVAVDVLAVVDPAVGAFDDPVAGLDDEAMGRFRPGDHVDGDVCPGRGGGDGLAGMALVDPVVGDGRRDLFGVAQQHRKGGPVLHVSRGYDDSGDQNAVRIDEHVPFDPVDFLGAVESAQPDTGAALTGDESTIAAGGLR